MQRVACVAAPFATMIVCRKLNLLQMAPPSHVELESQPTNVAAEQSEPGSRAETQRGGEMRRVSGVREREFSV